jgi:hypothetical protein
VVCVVGCFLSVIAVSLSAILWFSCQGLMLGVELVATVIGTVQMDELYVWFNRKHTYAIANNHVLGSDPVQSKSVLVIGLMS